MAGVKFFLRFVDNTVRTVEGDPNVVLHAANKLRPNLQLTLETPNEKNVLGFLDNNINVEGNRQVECRWYQKQRILARF